MNVISLSNILSDLGFGILWDKYKIQDESNIYCVIWLSFCQLYYNIQEGKNQLNKCLFNCLFGGKLLSNSSKLFLLSFDFSSFVLNAQFQPNRCRVAHTLVKVNINFLKLCYDFWKMQAFHDKQSLLWKKNLEVWNLL